MSKQNKLDEVLADLPSPWSFDLEMGTPAAPCVEPNAHKIADAICEMLQARINLRHEQARDRGYTGQWDDKDYWQRQEQLYNQACDRLARALRGEP